MTKSTTKMNSVGWKSVDVSLPDPGSNANHYDNPSTSKQADRDLEGQPAEGVGLFFGLEVLDGSMYEVKNNKMIFKKLVSETSTKSSDRETEMAKRSSEDVKPMANEACYNLTEQMSGKKRPPQKDADQAKKTNKKKKNNRSLEKTDEAVFGDDEAGEVKGSVEAKAATKRSGKKKKHKQPSGPDKKDSEQFAKDVVDPAKVFTLQSSWMMSTGGVTLHEKLCEGLVLLGFETPTPIQAATLPAAILGRRNIVGAAATGSGKTLAYVLPIMQHILDHSGDDQTLQALILAPTRELALQVAHECEKLIPKTTGAVVGGLAPHKQVRILDKKRPPIIIGTPGRLWELMSSREHEHLNNLCRVRFLVIDEADRMIQQGSFPQMEQILNAVHSANPLDSDDEECENDEEGNLDNEGDEGLSERLLSLPGIPGEARVRMLGDVLAQIDKQKRETNPGSAELDDDEFQNELAHAQGSGDDEDLIELPSVPPVQRQTLVFSATLTLAPSATSAKRSRRQISKKLSLTGAIAEILEKAHAHGQTKVVDLTSSNKLVAKDKTVTLAKEGSKSNYASRLPPGLRLEAIECTQKHKDSHLYAYLVTTQQGASGPCLIFCNSIAGVKRVGATLQTLGLPVKMLHAHMPQKARFKAVESLRLGTDRSIVVSTDVSARGLDILSVSTVVHYDVARGVDTFIHRAGRTARGIGESAIGTSLSLVASAEDKQHKIILSELGKELFKPVSLDGRLLADAQERVNLASKIVSCDEVESKSKSSNKWFQEAAAEAGLEVDEDMLDEGLAGGDLRDQQRLREAEKARSVLKMLLAQPLVAQRFGKFLSRNSSAGEAGVAGHVVPIVANKKGKKKRHSGHERGSKD